MATAINTGLLTPAQAQILVAASQGTPLFESVPAYTGPSNFQASLLCGYLLDMLAGKQILWNQAYNGDDVGSIIDSLCIVLVVNRLTVPLAKSGQDVYAGWPWAQPAGEMMNPVTGAISGAGEIVPPADKDGNAGFAVWAVSSAENRGAVSFGLSFQADPSAWPHSMSLGVLLWNETLHAINLIAEPSAETQAMNNAYYDTANNYTGTKQMTVSNSDLITGETVAVTIHASLQQPDPTNFWLAIVSVNPS